MGGGFGGGFDGRVVEKSPGSGVYPLNLSLAWPHSIQGTAWPSLL